MYDTQPVCLVPWFNRGDLTNLGTFIKTSRSTVFLSPVKYKMDVRYAIILNLKKSNDAATVLHT